MEPLKRKRNCSNLFCSELEIKTLELLQLENHIKDLSFKCSRNLIDIPNLIPAWKSIQVECDKIAMDEELSENQIFLCGKSKIMEEIFNKYKSLCSQVSCSFNLCKGQIISNLNYLYDLALYDGKNNLWIFDVSTRIRKSQIISLPNNFKLSCNACFVQLPSHSLFFYDHSSIHPITGIIDLINFSVKVVTTKGKRFNEAWMVHNKTYIYLFGYFFNGASFWSIVGKFDLERNRWMDIVQPVEKVAFAACVEFNGKLLSIGKNMKRIYQYDLNTESYSSLWRKNDRLANCKVMFKLETRAYIVGKDCIIESDVWNENNWNLISDWNFGIDFCFNTVKEHNGQIFVGGLYQGWIIIYKFDPRGKKFTRIETRCESYN